MKKTEFITLRTDANTKAILEQLAAAKKWSISQLTEEIIQQWLKEHPTEPQ
jgi:DNA-binding FrmR family transcriptional regulator